MATFSTLKVGRPPWLSGSIFSEIRRQEVNGYVIRDIEMRIKVVNILHEFVKNGPQILTSDSVARVLRG